MMAELSPPGFENMVGCLVSAGSGRDADSDARSSLACIIFRAAFRLSSARMSSKGSLTGHTAIGRGFRSCLQSALRRC